MLALLRAIDNQFPSMLDMGINMEWELVGLETV
jgi:hypothetical protein